MAIRVDVQHPDQGVVDSFIDSLPGVVCASGSIGNTETGNYRRVVFISSAIRCECGFEMGQQDDGSYVCWRCGNAISK